MPDNLLREIAGVIHIHSSYSDGSKSVEEIAAIGEKAGLDFLMFTDHNTLRPLHDGKQRFYGKTAVIIGYEIEDVNDENHYLSFGLNDVLQSNLNPKEYVEAVKDAGGLGIIAHPDEVRNAFPQYPSYPWTDWDVEGFDGLEIWNHMSAWMESLKRINMLKMAISPRRSLRGPTEKVLQLWDEISRTRKVAGIGSADVHAHLYRRGPIRLTIFPYKVQFRSIRTHLLLDSPLSKDILDARNQIFSAIRNCRVFVSNFRWGDANGFRFFVRTSDAIIHTGDSGNISANPVLCMSSPKEAEIRIIKDGQPFGNMIGEKFEIRVSSPGLYRVELYIGGKGWIYSNHIRITA
ncbi:MAG: histidinol-phosphatase [candidate division Zixibacteria bacterium]